MKTFNYFLPACIFAMCVSWSACSSYDNKQDEPPVPNTGTTNLITSLADPDVTSHFIYENGVMTQGYDGYYGDFVIGRKPFLITSNFESKYESVYMELKDIQTNDKGYITSARITMKEGDYNSVDYNSTGRLTVEYDPNGYITKMEQEATDGGGSLACTWANGNLVKVVHHWEWRTNEGKIDDAGNQVYYLSYPEDAPLNSGVYVLGESGIIETEVPDFLWIAGLFGKTTKNIPTLIKSDCTYLGDYDSHDTQTYTEKFRASYDSKGRIKLLYKDNRPYIAVAYDGTTAVLPQE